MTMAPDQKALHEKLRVVSAAIKIKTPNGDITVSDVPPARHHNLLGVMNWLTLKYRSLEVGGEQGFLLSDGRFVNRKQALTVARRAEQIIRRCGGDDRELFSENLW